MRGGWGRWAAALIVVASLPAARADAVPNAVAPGLDPTFGRGGVSLVDAGVADDAATGIVRTGDGGAVVSGIVVIRERTVLWVTRFDAGLRPVVQFGDGGTARVELSPASPPSPATTRLVLDRAGRIVVGIGGRNLVVALGPTGVLDPSFGDGGFVRLNGGAKLVAVAPRQDGDGIVVAVERHEAPGVVREAAVGLGRDGNPDPAWGSTGGETVMPYTDVVNAGMAADGERLVLFGKSKGRGGYIARLDAGGRLDPTFGGGGDGIADIAGAPNGIDDLVALADHAIVAVARAIDGLGGHTAVTIRLSAAGQRDRSWTGDGRLEAADALTADPDGGFFVGMVRYRPDGEVDRRFGSGGSFRPTSFRGVVYPRRMLADGGGILLAGSVGLDSYAGMADRAGHQIQAWTRDRGWGGDDDGVGVAASGDSLRVADRASTSGLLQVVADGTVDRSFGRVGLAAGILTPPGLLGPEPSVAVIGRPPHGSLLVTEHGITAFDGGGSIDPSYGTGGVFRSAGLLHQPIRRVAGRPGGGLILLAAYPYACCGAEVLAVTPDGRADTAFNGGGPIVTEDGASHVAAVDAAGRVLLAWVSPSTFDNSTVMVSRLLPDGSPDPSFGGGTGMAVAQTRLPASNSAVSVAIDGAGNVVLAWSARDTRLRMIVARRLPDGRPDLTFANHGFRALPPSLDQPERVVIDSRHRIVVAGTSYQDGFAVRLTAAGALDSTLAGTGRLVLPRPPGEIVSIHDATVDEVGRVVLAGSSGPPASRDVLLARLTA